MTSRWTYNATVYAPSLTLRRRGVLEKTREFSSGYYSVREAMARLGLMAAYYTHCREWVTKLEVISTYHKEVVWAYDPASDCEEYLFESNAPDTACSCSGTSMHAFRTVFKHQPYCALAIYEAALQIASLSTLPSRETLAESVEAWVNQKRDAGGTGCGIRVVEYAVRTLHEKEQNHYPERMADFDEYKR